jgi:hypothetical protein
MNPPHQRKRKKEADWWVGSHTYKDVAVDMDAFLGIIGCVRLAKYELELAI